VVKDLWLDGAATFTKGPSTKLRKNTSSVSPLNSLESMAVFFHDNKDAKPGARRAVRRMGDSVKTQPGLIGFEIKNRPCMIPVRNIWFSEVRLIGLLLPHSNLNTACVSR
jgi:hypothetical protein